MGIQSLLPFLENATRTAHISEFKGQTVAIDSYCWLHKGAIGCALQLAKGEKTDVYVNYCLKYINMLKSFDIKPIMVFDGRHLPAKLKTEQKRRSDRKRSKKLGVEQLRLGKISEACHYFRQCIDITAEMVLNLIKKCRSLNIDCIVAPYEADAQLAFLNINKLADFVISEDSDLLVFGCTKVLYKLDLNGRGRVVESEKIAKCMKIREERYTFSKFRHMCILSGCDYLSSLPGIGIKKALTFISMTDETNPDKFLDKMPQYLNKSKSSSSLIVTPEYKEEFLCADATFQYQIVYNPVQRKLQTLNPVETDLKYLKNAGVVFDSDDAFQLAIGNLNAKTMERIDNWELPKNLNPFSIWSGLLTRSPRKVVKRESKINKPRKNSFLGVQALEEAKMEEDDEFERELKLYTQPSEELGYESGEEEKTDEILDEEDMESIETPSSQTSPVLQSKNPFIKKKISKWNLTVVNDKSLIKSKFFSQASSDASQGNTSDYASQTANSDNDSETNSSSESTIEVEVNQNHLFPDIHFETSNEPLEFNEAKGKVTGSALQSVENTVKIREKPRSEPEPKKRKINAPAPAKPAKNKNQPTILSMFQRMNTAR